MGMCMYECVCVRALRLHQEWDLRLFSVSISTCQTLNSPTHRSLRSTI